jgi:hypothetical protein
MRGISFDPGLLLSQEHEAGKLLPVLRASPWV